jgi:hypothetical protein
MLKIVIRPGKTKLLQPRNYRLSIHPHTYMVTFVKEEPQWPSNVRNLSIILLSCSKNTVISYCHTHTHVTCTCTRTSSGVGGFGRYSLGEWEQYPLAGQCRAADYGVQPYRSAYFSHQPWPLSYLCGE